MVINERLANLITGHLPRAPRLHRVKKSLPMFRVRGRQKVWSEQESAEKTGRGRLHPFHFQARGEVHPFRDLHALPNKFCLGAHYQAYLKPEVHAPANKKHV